MNEIIIHQDWYGDMIDRAVSALMRLERLEQTGFEACQWWFRGEILDWSEDECQEAMDCMRCEMGEGIDSLIDERDSGRARNLSPR